MAEIYSEGTSLLQNWSYDNMVFILELHIDGLVQDCNNSSALAMELLQSYTKPSIWLSSLGRTKHFTLIVQSPSRGFGKHYFFLQYRRIKANGVYILLLNI